MTLRGCTYSGGVDGCHQGGELGLHDVHGLRGGQIGAHEFGSEDEVGGVEGEEGQEVVGLRGEFQRQTGLGFGGETLGSDEGLRAQRFGDDGDQCGERFVHGGEVEVLESLDGLCAQIVEDDGEMIIQFAHGGIVLQVLADDGLRVAGREDVEELLNEGGIRARSAIHAKTRFLLEVVVDGGAQHA